MKLEGGGCCGRKKTAERAQRCQRNQPNGKKHLDNVLFPLTSEQKKESASAFGFQSTLPPRLAIRRGPVFNSRMKSLRIALAALFSFFALAAEKDATPASEIKVPDGFKVELLRSAATSEGSWVAMEKDAKGRLIISPQDEQPLQRVTLKADGSVDSISPIQVRQGDKTVRIGSAMGLLWAWDSLYVSGAGPEGLALYRLRDTNDDDVFESVEVLKKLDGMAGEHGSHALAKGPEGMLYWLHGNFVGVPRDISPESQHRNYRDDVVLPRGEDGNGFGRGMKPPGGFVLRGDKDGKNWQLWAGGMRNAYDFAFNRDGELFTFDSDMEWDWSMPWYRATRIYHLVSGGDYGFREGTAKWPAYYPDSLPPTLDVGIGSPTGTMFGYGAKFPKKYEEALYAMDWSYGRIFAIHLKPQGASYSATKEDFVRGKPLNVTDMVVGNDGAMYFTTGGRKTQSGLYRVSYVGAANDASVADAGKDARELRRKLEALHGRKEERAVDFTWPHLKSPDRWIRYAARVAIESQPVSSWAERALAEEDKAAGLTALLALARYGDRGQQNELIEALGRLAEKRFEGAEVLEALRVLQVSFARMGKPEGDMGNGVIEALDRRYPSQSAEANREIAQLLIFLQGPDVVEKTLKLVKDSATFEDQMFYMFHLRTLKSGWSRAQREQYFAWFNQAPKAKKEHPAEAVAWFKEAGREYSDGSSFPRFIANARGDAVASLTDQERNDLASIISRGDQQTLPKPRERKFVKEWRTADVLGDLDQISRGGRNFQRGRQAFIDAQCLACHRMRDEGGSVGPDLTAVASRFARKDILESVIEPSKVNSEQYAATDFVLKNEDEVSGRILEENDERFIVLTNPLANVRTEVKKSEVAKRTMGKLSVMPEGLVNTLTKDEILDMIAYMEAAGQDWHAVFSK